MKPKKVNQKISFNGLFIFEEPDFVLQRYADVI